MFNLEQKKNEKKKGMKEKHEWSKFCPSIQLHHSFQKHGRGR